MAVFMGAFPVLPGKEDEVRKFAQETNDRIDEFAESHRNFGTTKEEMALQQTPMGALMLVRFEAPSVEEVFAKFAQSQSDFDVWSKKRILEISGIDLEAPSSDPPPEILVDWSA